MCSYIALNTRWITGVLSDDIAAILPCTALYLQPKCSRTLYFQYTNVSNSFFNTTLYCKQAYFTLEKRVQCAYGVFLSDDIAAILPCTAIYVQPKRSHTLHVQYTRVSNCFFNTTLCFNQTFLTWEKWVQCAYGVFLHCRECALNIGCFIRRYRSDPAMYSTLRATKI